MAQLRDEAEALAIALTSGVCDVAEVIAWSDAQLLREDRPLGALCDVSLAHDRYPQDVAAMLRQLPGAPARSVVNQLLLMLIGDKLKADTDSADRIASALNQMALAEEIEDSQLRDVAWCAWDALDLADAGMIQDSREQVVSEMMNALDSAAARTVVTWSTELRARRAEQP